MSDSRRRFLQHGVGLAAGAMATTGRWTAVRGAAPSSRRYRAAVIGRTGRGNYGHGLDLVYQAFENIEVVAVADENADGRREAAERLGVKATYASYERMLREEKPDLVSVAPRWADCHHDMVLAAAEAGAHIYLEKPMARTLEEADAMIDACEHRGCKMAIAHQMHLHPVMATIQKQIADGAIGQLLEMRGRGKEDRRAGGEDLMVLGTHVMDLMRLFAGDPQWVWATVTVDERPIGPADVRDGNEGLGWLAGDSIQATYGFANGVHGSFASKRNTDGGGGRFGLDLYGSKGIITIRAGADPAVYHCKTTSWAPSEGRQDWHRVVPEQKDRWDGGFQAANARVVANLLDAIQHDRRPRSSGHDGRAALEMILAVYASQIEGKAVALPLTNRAHPLDEWIARRHGG